MAYYEPIPEQPRCCDQPNCAEDGLFKAPKSRSSLNEYYWFCLDHVRAYNKAWNYCAGMNEDEIEDEIRRSTVWDRPTWPAGIPPRMEEHLRQAIHNSDGFYGHEKQAEPPRPKVHTPESKALSILGLAASATFQMIKEKYRELVKQHHPDRNAGDVHAEERFKTISQAFHTLKRAHQPDKVS